MQQVQESQVELKAVSCVASSGNIAPLYGVIVVACITMHINLRYLSVLLLGKGS